MRRPPARNALARAVADGEIEIETIDLAVSNEQEALARFDARPAFRGRGDAEVLALAVTRGYVVGSDERALRRAVRVELDRSCLMSTLDVIVLAVREARTSVEEGERLLSSLDIGPLYLLRLEEAGLTLRELAHGP